MRRLVLLYQKKREANFSFGDRSVKKHTEKNMYKLSIRVATPGGTTSVVKSHVPKKAGRNGAPAARIRPAMTVGTFVSPDTVI